MFKEARKQAGLSIEAAAFRLHIGSRTLINYENCHTLVPPEIVLKMAEIYREPTLTARYCAENCPIGQAYSQPVEIKNLAESVLALIKEYNDVREIRDSLIELAADGIISEDELPEFRKILDELLDLEQKIEALKLWAASYLPIGEMIRRRKEKAAIAAAR